MSQNDQKIKRPKELLLLYVYTDVAEITNQYKRAIDTLLEKDKDVPAELIRGFLSCFAWEKNNKKDEEKRYNVYLKSKELFEKACERFNNDHFKFSISSDPIEIGSNVSIKRTYKYELISLLKWLAYDVCFYMSYTTGSKRSKESLQRVLGRIDLYFKQDSVKHIVWPGRKRKIVAGFLLNELGGLGLSRKQNPSNKDLFLRVNNILRPSKKSKSF